MRKIPITPPNLNIQAFICGRYKIPGGRDWGGGVADILEECSSQSEQSARLSFQSSKLGPPTPLPSSTPPLGPREETHSLVGEEVGGPKSDDGTDTLVLYICIL
jgi:hypothetical protein